MIVLTTFLLFALVSAFDNRQGDHALQGIAKIRSADGKVKGQIEFLQHFKQGAPTRIVGNFTGLSEGFHGIGIMEYGNMLKGCESMGGEFDPDRTRQRMSLGFVGHRVGTLGNIQNGTYSDPHNHKVSLFGRNSVMGRGVVIFANPDDGGQSDSAASRKNGNVGAPIACGVVGRLGGNFV